MMRLNKILIAVFGMAMEKASALKTDERGASALEFAIFAGILSFGLLNTADISIYIYKRMQVENATERVVRRRFEHPALRVRPRVESKHVAAGWDQRSSTGFRIGNGNPRIIICRIA